MKFCVHVYPAKKLLQMASKSSPYTSSLCVMHSVSICRVNNDLCARHVALYTVFVCGYAQFDPSPLCTLGEMLKD